jgi:hypothetical protein
MGKVFSSFFTVIFLLGMPAVASPPGSTDDTLLEVLLKKVYIPRKGYDDNDHVEAVAEGELPNPCFTLGRTETERLPQGGGFRLHQMAWKSSAGACNTGDLIDDPVPFISKVRLGELRALNYRLEFSNEAGEKESRSFEVEVAKSPNIDNFSYATIRGIEMEEEYRQNETVSVILRGVYPTPCSEFQEIDVQVLDDVVLVLPILGKATGENCHHRGETFKKKVELGTLKPGNYLLHVRSRSGNALYQPFTVAGAHR